MDLLYPNRQWPMPEGYLPLEDITTMLIPNEHTPQLCGDLWLKILEYLKLREVVLLRRVCSGWNELIIRRILTPRKELTICLAPYSTSKFFRREAISDCYYVRHYRQILRPLAANHAGLQQLKMLNFLVGQWWLTTEFSWCQQPQQKQLKSATFIDCTFTVTLASVADHLRGVTRLELINCDLLDADIRTIGETIGSGVLEHLNVSFNGQLTGAHIEALGTPLRSLNLGHCHRLDDFRLCYGLQALLYKGVHLEVLNLKPLNPNGALHLVTSFVVGSLDHLQELKLNPNFHLFAAEQRNVASGQPPPSASSSSSVPGLAATMKKLTLLGRCELPPVNGNDRRRQHGSALSADRYLRWFFTGKASSPSFSATPAFAQLQYLSLTDWPEKWTSDEGLAAVFSACPNLLHLKLVGLPFATDRSLDLIPRLMTRLRTVKLVDVNLSDRLVVTLLERCPALRTLVIDFPDGGQAQPYHLSEAVIHEAVALCSRCPARRLTVRISKSLLPTHKLFTIPANLSLEIVRSRAFHGRAAAIYVDEPVVG